MLPFIHLDIHTEYSLIDSTVRLDNLIAAAVANNMPAIAVTDHINLFCLIKFYKAAMAAGIKPIAGAEIYFNNPDDAEHPFKAILLCKDNHGYQNLIKLISQIYLSGRQADGRLFADRSWLAARSAGLIMLSGAQYGDVGQLICAGKLEQAEKIARRWATLFPDSYYFELVRVGHENEEFYIQNVVQLAEKIGVPVVAANAVRFLTGEDFTAHEARVCIHEGFVLTDPRRLQRYTAAQYFRSSQEMTRLFADIPSAIENTVEIAKRCNLTLTLGKVFLPNFPIPAGLTTEHYFRTLAEAGLAERLAINFQLDPAKRLDVTPAYQARLNYEIEILEQMGFLGYFLIVADFIQWAKKQEIPVGPGRGSGAGSLVAYVLRITDLDPIVHGLLFERFLNPERVSMPDFDIDFCMDGRDRVIEYVANTYGRNAVSQIITYGTMAAKAVIRDVGRVLGQPYGFVDKLAKLIPFEVGITLETALAQEELLRIRYQQEDEVRELIDLALKLEGLTRNVGKHAGGVVIAPSELSDFTPIYTDSSEGSLVSQYDKDDAEAVGLIKFDFLGLRTLTIIDWAVRAINQRLLNENLPTLDITLLPLTDVKTFDLLKVCNTTAVFQLESRGMKDLVKRLQPDCFEDIVALVALFRPGPLQSGMVDDFINRKHGRARVEYPHPSLALILKETYGVILYQEQVMQIAQVLAGYTLGAADLLRRAMGKKKPEEMAKQREFFMAGSIKNAVDVDVATRIFDLMEKFAGYGFNKSHSAAYALLAYQTAWLKCHYPAEFMAAVLSSDLDNTDKILIFYEDAVEHKLNVLPPDINHSEYKFVAVDANTIRYGLGAIKGAGEAALSAIIANRREAGAFTDLFEFCQRIDLRKANRRVLEGLIKSGALDCFKQDRNVLMKSLEKALKSAEQTSRNSNLGQADLFGTIMTQTTTADYVVAEIWNERERLEAEKESLGLYLSSHPLDRYQAELSKLTTCKVRDFAHKSPQSMRIGGMIVGVRTLNTKKGDRMAVITLDDRTGRTDIPIFPEAFQNSRDLLEKDTIVIIEGDLQEDRFSGGQRFNTRSIMSFEKARQLFAKAIQITLEANNTTPKIIAELKEILSLVKGGRCAVLINYQRDDAAGQLNLSKDWQIEPTDQLLEQLSKLVGHSLIEIHY